jgi:hypothetical protein
LRWTQFKQLPFLWKGSKICWNLLLQRATQFSFARSKIAVNVALSAVQKGFLPFEWEEKCVEARFAASCTLL